MTDIVIVGEAWGAEEEAKGKPFVGPTGKFLTVLLSATGIDRGKCYLTNVFNLRPKPTNDISNLCGPRLQGIPKMPAMSSGKYVRIEYASELNRLYHEIRVHNPKVILALGGTATWALCHQPKISRVRGSPLMSITGHKVLPTYHPSAVNRDMTLRPVVFADLKKALRESAFPEIRRPVREFWLYPDLDDLARYEYYIREASLLSVDIETFQDQITCIGFATGPERALVIPFCSRTRLGGGQSPDGNYWPDLDSELKAWAWIRRQLASGIPIVGQNFLYDISYLWRFYGMPIPSFSEDTMLLHHAKQLEMEKSLAFLGSLYSNEPAWKFMRTKATIKKED